MASIKISDLRPTTLTLELKNNELNNVLGGWSPDYSNPVNFGISLGEYVGENCKLSSFGFNPLPNINFTCT